MEARRGEVFGGSTTRTFSGNRNANPPATIAMANNFGSNGKLFSRHGKIHSGVPVSLRGLTT
ncbi:MAG: hypothetical protein HC767_08895 [Akkermansiaceae bacterium]|nr:hypothetical protein [Akkermansiaceae bacterium]